MNQYCGDIYASTQQERNLSRDEMATLAQNGFRMAWLSEAEKEAYLNSIDAYVNQSKLESP